MGVMTEEEYHRLVSSLGGGGGGASLRERQVERPALGGARLSSPLSDARTASARHARDNVRVWRRNAGACSSCLKDTLCVCAACECSSLSTSTHTPSVHALHPALLLLLL